MRSANVIVFGVFLIGVAIGARIYPYADLSTVTAMLIVMSMFIIYSGVSEYLSENGESTPSKQFSCISCGSTLKMYPPDDVHMIASRTQADNAVVVEHKCKDCNSPNTLYWSNRRQSA